MNTEELSRLFDRKDRDKNGEGKKGAGGSGGGGGGAGPEGVDDKEVMESTIFSFVYNT